LRKRQVEIEYGQTTLSDLIRKGRARVKISVICVGKLKEKYLKDGIDEYAKRLSRFCDLSIVEVNDEKAPESLSAAQEVQLKRKEGDRIAAKIKEGSIVIALDIKGEKMSSEEFADKMQAFFISGGSNITFLIGGSLGLSEELLKTAHLRLSFSDMTFPHQLARLVLVEQLYRAFKIINGETYHK
jgi:23S rRNA (pseudouridine1915-N3)-methyltransferase